MKHTTSLLKRTLVAATCTIASLCTSPALAQKIVVGGKNFTEQQILAEMTTQYLRNHGFTVDKRVGMGTAALRQALEAGQIDLYWEYVGTGLIVFHKVKEKLDADAAYETVRTRDASKGLVWLDRSKANNGYAFAMRRTEAQAKGIQSISDLAAYINQGNTLSFASNAEFYSRVDGLRPLQNQYSFEFGRANVVRMDSGLVYSALRDGQVDVGLVFATDGRIQAFDFVTLVDDKGQFPDYATTPVVRQAVLDQHPGLAQRLNALAAKLDDTVMRQLNATVDVEKQSIERVAEQFLAAQTW